VRVALALLVVLAFAARASATKPLSPVKLRARLVSVDPATKTAVVEIRTAAPLQGGTTAVTCELPKGASAAPADPNPPQAATADTDDPKDARKTPQRPAPKSPAAAPDRVLQFRVSLPPAGGRMVVKAECRGPAATVRGIAAVTLPPADAKTAPAKPRNVLTTDNGMKLRIHK
jgi:hypothetical protein